MDGFSCGSHMCCRGTKCEKLNNITVGSGVRYFGEMGPNYLFRKNSLGEISAHFPSIEVNQYNQYFKSIDGVLYSKDGTTIYTYPSEKKDDTFAIPEGVNNINRNAFYFNSYLKTIELPSTITKIDSDAFPNVGNLECIVYEGTREDWNKITGVNNLGSDIASKVRFLS